MQNENVGPIWYGQRARTDSFLVLHWLRRAYPILIAGGDGRDPAVQFRAQRFLHGIALQVRPSRLIPFWVCSVRLVSLWLAHVLSGSCIFVLFWCLACLFGVLDWSFFPLLSWLILARCFLLFPSNIYYFC